VFLTVKEFTDLLSKLYEAKKEMSGEYTGGSVSWFSRLESTRKKSIYIPTYPTLDVDYKTKTCSISTYGVEYLDDHHDICSFKLGNIELNYEQIIMLAQWTPHMKEFIQKLANTPTTKLALQCISKPVLELHTMDNFKLHPSYLSGILDEEENGGTS
jgi:hypothetical protein